MKNECESDIFHVTNYYMCCCLKHLLLMHKQSKIQLMMQKYGILLVRTLNHYNKNNNIIFLIEA